MREKHLGILVVVKGNWIKNNEHVLSSNWSNLRNCNLSKNSVYSFEIN